jgi:gamma-glutamyltranspeptidase/glutathione hydrolase
MTIEWDFPYASRRMPVLADNVVATSQPLAVSAAIQVLREGGNAVDAAITAAATLTVVEPTGNGLGSDAFAIVWDGEKLHGINGSGRSPAKWTPARFASLDAMPKFGWDAVTVPGAIALWKSLADRFGTLPFARLLAPAIEYATHGFPVSPLTAQSWQRAAPTYADMPEFASAFLPHGRAPQAGERFTNPELAKSLEDIAATGGESFYRGDLAKRTVSHAQRQGGQLSFADLAEHQSEWVAPLALSYRDVVVHELPPNGQGIAALIALGILRHAPLGDVAVDGADFLHWQIEAMKLAFDVTQRHVADPATMRVATEQLLAADFLRALADRIDPRVARPPGARLAEEHGTVYLATADAGGMMVSFIQSNYMGFGSGVVVPGTGISLQNRACGFVLESGHPNQVDGSKRPFHTIIPGFVTRGGKPLLCFGVMGGRMQAQGHVQMVVRVVDYGQNPQAASDAPRWCLLDDNSVALEPGFEPDVVAALSERGHRLALDQPRTTFGGAQLIYRHGTGYVAASDHRKDGQACGF